MIWRVPAPSAFMVPTRRTCRANRPAISVAPKTAQRTSASTVDASSIRTTLVIMRWCGCRLTAADQSRKKLHDLCGGARIEVSRRLVCDDQRRVVRQRAGDRDTLLLTAGKRHGQLLGLVRDTHLREQVERARAASGRGRSGRNPSEA
jgi:hypothetical protein